MDAKEWLGCDLIEIVPGRHSGDPVFKGTRLPVDAITGNYDAFLEEGLSPDQAVAATLEVYPRTPGGADAIRAVVDYRALREHQLQS